MDGRLSGDYAQIAKLVASDAAADDKFGSSVAIDGDTIVIGAATTRVPLAPATSSHDDGGASVRPGGQADGLRRRCDGLFGRSVAIDGNTIVVGAYGPRGAASPCTTDGGATYVEVAKLTASDAAADDASASVAIAATPSWSERPTVTTTPARGLRLPHDRRRRHVSAATAATPQTTTTLASSVAIAAAPSWSGPAPRAAAARGSGSAYVFRTTDGGVTYPQVDKLTASDARAGDEFHLTPWRSAAPSRVVDDMKRTATLSYSGAAYVFRTTDGGATYGPGGQADC